MFYSIVYNHVLIPSLISIVIVILILLIKLILKQQLSAEWHYYIWVLLLIRLLIPYNIQTNFSIDNYVKMPTKNIINQIPIIYNAETAKIVNSSSVNKVQSNMLFKKNKAQDIKLQNGIVSKPINMVSIIWLIGFTVMLMYVFTVNITSYNILKKSPLYKNRKLNELLKECKDIMKIKAEISIATSNKIVNIPSLWGILKAQIIIPLALVDELTNQELKYIILHELSHFKRKDNIINLFLNVIKVVNWFNPFIWYAFYVINDDSEIACDAIVLRHIQNEEKLKYGKTLISLYQLTSMSKELVGITTLFKNKYQLKRRISMIAKFKKKSIIWSIVVIVFVALTGALMLTSGKETIDQKKESNIVTTKPKVDTINKNNIEQTNKVTEGNVSNTASKNNIEQNNKVTEENASNIASKNDIEQNSKVTEKNPSNTATASRSSTEQTNTASENNNSASEDNNTGNYTQQNKLLTKTDAISLILKGGPAPKYFIPVKAADGNINNLEKVDDSDAFLCNDNDKLDNGILVELPNFNENSQTNYFLTKSYDAIRNGGDGLADRGSITNTGEVKFLGN